MVTRKQYQQAVARSCRMLAAARMAITPQEKNRLEVADFGLGELERTGLQVITYVNTERVCAKEVIMFPRQTCPEHRHPTVDGRAGKEETFRVRWGTVFLYVPGPPARRPNCRPPRGSEQYYTVFHEIRLKPGDQYTMIPDTLHWFQAGPKGAIVSEFSTRSTDEADFFTDTRIRRIPEVEEA